MKIIYNRDMKKMYHGHLQIVSSFHAAVLAVTFSLLLAGCGGGAKGGDTEATPSTAVASPPATITSGPDTTPPVITITAPTTGTSFTTNSASVIVVGTATDNVGLAQISWSNTRGGWGSQAASGISASSSFNVALTSGANAITLTARDAAGNLAHQKVLTVTYTVSSPSADTTAPAITITAPTTGTTYATATAGVTVTAAATDNVGLSQISWSNSKGGSGSLSVSGTSASSGFNVALTSGANTITVTTRDAAGNSAQKQLTVTYTPPPASNTATLAWNAASATNLAGYRLYYGTAPRTYLQPLGQGLSVGNVTAHTLMGLSYRTRYYFAVTAIDAAGNESGYSNEAFKDVP